MFRYRKLYADLITESGSVCVAYVTWLTLFGFELSTAGYEWYSQTGERRVLRAVGPVAVEMVPGGVELGFTTPAGAFALTLRGASHEPGAAPQLLTPHLSWRVQAERAEARATGVAGAASLVGAGYADYVEMTRPPRALGLASVEWGRGHAAGESFVFTRARFGDGRVFRFGLRNGTLESALELTRDQDAGLLIQLGDATVMLQNERVLHAGAALDRARFPGRAERAFARLCSGSMRETRWLARARFPNGESALALHERVLWNGARVEPG